MINVPNFILIKGMERMADGYPAAVINFRAAQVKLRNILQYLDPETGMDNCTGRITGKDLK